MVPLAQTSCGVESEWEARAVAGREWAAEGVPAMPRDRFKRIIFETCDLWCREAGEDEYADWLCRAFIRAFGRGRYGRATRAVEEDEDEYETEEEAEDENDNVFATASSVTSSDSDDGRWRSRRGGEAVLESLKECKVDIHDILEALPGQGWQPFVDFKGIREIGQLATAVALGDPDLFPEDVTPSEFGYARPLGRVAQNERLRRALIDSLSEYHDKFYAGAERIYPGLQTCPTTVNYLAPFLPTHPDWAREIDARGLLTIGDLCSLPVNELPGILRANVRVVREILEDYEDEFFALDEDNRQRQLVYPKLYASRAPVVELALEADLESACQLAGIDTVGHLAMCDPRVVERFPVPGGAAAALLGVRTALLRYAEVTLRPSAVDDDEAA